MASLIDKRGSTLDEIVRRLAGGRFLVVGRAGIDLNAMPLGVRVEDAETFIPTLGGSAANIAVALVRNDLRATLLTALSDDAVGRFCRKQLKNFGVDLKHVRGVSGAVRTSLATVESRLDDGHAVIYRNDAADFQLSLDDIETVDFAQYDALVLTGTALAHEPSRSAGFHSIEAARAKGMPVIIDFDYRPYSWTSRIETTAIYKTACEQCDIVVGNEEEFAVLAGRSAGGLKEARRLSVESAALVVYKRGPLGAITILEGDELTTGAFAVNAIKPSGAGDAFLGSLLAALARGTDLHKSVIRSSAAASIVVASIGCAPAMPTAREVDAFLASRGGGLEILSRITPS